MSEKDYRLKDGMMVCLLKDDLKVFSSVGYLPRISFFFNTVVRLTIGSTKQSIFLQNPCCFIVIWKQDKWFDTFSRLAFEI